jgi:hypothetical protein
MRKSFLYLIALNILFVGCNSTEKEGITEGSIWKLIETRVSPGGQVEFTPTNEVEFIEFQKNNEVRKTVVGAGKEAQMWLAMMKMELFLLIVISQEH